MATTAAHVETSFERCLRDFKYGLTVEERQYWSETTLEDLQKTIAAVQQKQESTRTLQNFRRSEGFLEGMRANAAVIEVYLNVHPFVGLVWGPMKFIIQVASTSAAAFNTILEAYQRIGEQMPLFAQYQDLFESNPNMRHVLELNFQDVFDFHRHALKFFRRSTWRKTLDGLWKNFETRFQRILDNMSEHKQLLERSASVAEFEASRQARLLAEAKFESFEKEERLRKKAFLMTWLAAVDVQSDQEMGQLAREGHPESGRWLLKKDRFRAWYNQTSCTTPMLWVHGRPGAGKSVLASMVIDEANSVPGAGVVYFYCHDNDRSKSFASMARSILSQLLRLEESILVDLYHAAVSQGSPSLDRKTLAESLLDICFADLENHYVVLDGLDECPEPEQKAIVSWLRRFVDSSLTKTSPNRCVVFSQYDGSTRSLLGAVPTIGILPSDNKADIGSFCRSRATLIASKFGLDASESDSIASTTSDRADGMFLFAKLVMQNLMDQTSLASLREEMRPDIFPRGLEQAYSRIARRILRDDRPAYKETAHSLLAWVTCAVSPLKWVDIQAMAAIDVNEGLVDMQTRRMQVDHVDLCSPLVEARKNGSLSLVHSTARAFLIRHRIVNTALEHLLFATKCLEYFCFDVFASQQVADARTRAVLDGSYAFSSYAFVSWPRHVISAFDCGETDSEFNSATQLAREGLIEALGVFMDMHYQRPEKKSKVPTSALGCVKTLQHPELHERLLNTLASMANLTTQEIRGMKSFVTLELFRTMRTIHDELARLAEYSGNRSPLHEYYGDGLFKCPRLYCDRYLGGFVSRLERDEHIKRHERSFYCPHSGCLYARIGCVTEKELEAHTEKYHSAGPREDDFPVDVGKNSLKRKHPATQGCHLCSKTFTRAHNLRSHLRTHTEERPFVCTVCGKAFARQHDRKTHERRHEGKQYVCRGKLKAGGEWGCGKDFPKAKGLQRHFESDDGQLCIKPLREEESARESQAPTRQATIEPSPESNSQVMGRSDDTNETYVEAVNPDAANKPLLPLTLLEHYPEFYNAHATSWSGSVNNNISESGESDSESAWVRAERLRRVAGWHQRQALSART